MPSLKAKISGVGGYVPDYILTNKELESMVDTSDEWITTRTGIKERRILKEKNKGSSFLATQAVNQLLEKTNTDPADVELVICCTITPDYQFPASANEISSNTGMKNAFGYDLLAACSGFLYGLETGRRYIESGHYKKVVIIGVDKMSSIINYTDRNTCVIFGDGGGAVLLEPDEEGFGIQDSYLKADGGGRPHLYQKAGGSVNPANISNLLAEENYVYQEGKYVFKHAVVNMAESAALIMERNELNAENVDWLVPHQANLRIIDATRERMGIDESKVMLNIHRYGNTTNGTLPLCLYDYENKLKKGDNLIFAAFGGGFTWGSIYLKWAYNS